jgi:protein-disulfide isomerase
MRFGTPLLPAGALALLGACALFASPAVHAEAFSDVQKTEIQKVVHDYLVSNPEVVKEAIEALTKKEKIAEAASREQALSKDADKLFNSPNQAVVGNPKGDVTVVEFFDYNCGYCKQSLANVAKLIENDPKVRVVLKDFAILGPDSLETAEVASAARMQLKGEKFWEFHRKLLGTRGHIGKQQALAVAKESGADMNQLEKDLKSPAIRESLEEVDKLADSLRFSGTPSWVIGKEAIVGGVSFEELKSKVENIRKCGKSTC